MEIETESQVQCPEVIGVGVGDLESRVLRVAVNIVFV